MTSGSRSFSGRRCHMPLLTGTDLVSVGLTAGSIRTAAPARIPCAAGITAYAGEPYTPETDLYHAAMQQLAVIRGGFANRYRLLADRDGRLIAASDGSCIACKEV